MNFGSASALRGCMRSKSILIEHELTRSRQLASTLWIHSYTLPNKIIYDKETKSMYVVSQTNSEDEELTAYSRFAGFRNPELHTTPPPWDPVIWAQYHLINYPAVRRPGWFKNLDELSW